MWIIFTAQADACFCQWDRQGHTLWVYSVFWIFCFFKQVETEWTPEVGITVSDDLWTEVMKEIKSCSSGTKFQLTQFRVVHRGRCTKSRHAMMYLNMSVTDVPRLLVTSLKCFGQVPHWGTNGSLISTIFDRVIKLAHIALFVIPEAGKDASLKLTNVISFTSLLVRWRMLLLWKKL